MTATEGVDATADFTVTISAVHERPVTVAYATTDQTAVAGADYTATAGVLTIPAYALTGTVRVPVRCDPVTEPPETFRVTLSNPSAPVTIAQGVGVGTILNGVSQVPIDPALPGQYLADLSGGPGITDELLVANPHAVPVTARLTWVFAGGLSFRREFPLAAGQRVTVPLASEPGVAGFGDVSVAVQSLDPAHPLDAEHSAYWGSVGGGRSTEGVTPAATWYLAEGSTWVFDEWVTVFNPTNGPVTVTFEAFGTSGPLATRVETIAQGPGRVKLPVGLWLGTGDHSLRITAQGAAGPAGVVVERTMQWRGTAEGHSTPGVLAPTAMWYFADGGVAAFCTTYAVFNPGTESALVLFYYMHENGQYYSQTASVPAQTRVTIAPGAWVPAGAFASFVQVLSGPPVVVERQMYGGATWLIGHAGVGATQLGTTWRFTEGVNDDAAESYLLLGNPNGSTAAVTLTFTKTDGTVVTSSTSIPGVGRTTVSLKDIPGLETGSFRTVVTSTNGVSFVAERATYWTVGGGGQSMLAGETSVGEPDAGRAQAPARARVSPYAPATFHGAGPRIYERVNETVIEVGGDGVARSEPLSRPDAASPDVGPPLTEAAAVTSGLLPSAPLADVFLFNCAWTGSPPHGREAAMTRHTRSSLVTVAAVLVALGCWPATVQAQDPRGDRVLCRPMPWARCASSSRRGAR